MPREAALSGRQKHISQVLGECFYLFNTGPSIFQLEMSRGYHFQVPFLLMIKMCDGVSTSQLVRVVLRAQRVWNGGQK